MNKLQVYTNLPLEVGRRYSTIVLDNSYYPVEDEVKIVNTDSRVRAIGKIINSLEGKFDSLGYTELKNNSAPQLRDWGSAFDYFKARYNKYFAPDGPIQVVTFEVISNISFDDSLDNFNEAEKEMGLPSDGELGIFYAMGTG